MSSEISQVISFVSNSKADSTDKLNFLENFQDDVLDYLYNLEPPANNLFWAGNFQTFATNDGKYEEKNIALPNAQFRIKKISFDSPGLEFGDDNKHTFQQFVKSYKPVQEVKIDFRDDFAHSVKRYHMDWQKYWYHRKHGVFRTGAYGKIRGFDIILFHYAPESSGAGLIKALPVARPILGIQIRGMMPATISGWEFDTDAPNNEQLFSATYKLNNAPQFMWFDDKLKAHYAELEDCVANAKGSTESFSPAESKNIGFYKTAFDEPTFV